MKTLKFILLCVICVICGSAFAGETHDGLRIVGHDLSFDTYTNRIGFAAVTNYADPTVSATDTGTWYYAIQPTNSLGALNTGAITSSTVSATGRIVRLQWVKAAGMTGYRIWRGTATNLMTNVTAAAGGASATNWFDYGTNVWSSGAPSNTITNTAGIVLADGTTIRSSSDLASATNYVRRTGDTISGNLSIVGGTAAVFTQRDVAGQLSNVFSFVTAEDYGSMAKIYAHGSSATYIGLINKTNGLNAAIKKDGVENFPAYVFGDSHLSAIGSISMTGSISAATLSGALSATNLTSGIVPAGRLATNSMAINGVISTTDGTNRYWTATPPLNLVNATNLNAANLAAGSTVSAIDISSASNALSKRFVYPLRVNYSANGTPTLPAWSYGDAPYYPSGWVLPLTNSAHNSYLGLGFPVEIPTTATKVWSALTFEIGPGNASTGIAFQCYNVCPGNGSPGDPSGTRYYFAITNNARHWLTVTFTNTLPQGFSTTNLTTGLDLNFRPSVNGGLLASNNAVLFKAIGGFQ